MAIASFWGRLNAALGRSGGPGAGTKVPRACAFAANETRRVLVEGWRGINHSYALVNQRQLLHLSKNPRLRISHNDLPYYRPEWRATGAGFDPDQTRAIDSIQGADRGRFDAIYRIGCPYRLYGGPARRIFVFGTAEYGLVDARAIYRGIEMTEKHDNDDIEIITPSQWSRQGFIASGFDAEKVHVVPHGVEPSEYRPAEEGEKQAIRAELRLPEEAFIFLNVGAMTQNKGTTQLLMAFSVHRDKYPNSCLLLKGADHLYGAHIQQRIDEAMSWNRPLVAAAMASVIYCGEDLSNSAMSRLYRASDAYVSPYLAEAFNMPVLEAMASGLPVIVTKGGPTDDFCRNEFSLKIESRLVAHAEDPGKHLEPDIDCLVGHMARVVEDGRFREAAARAAPACAATGYSWRAVTDRLAELLVS